MTPNEIDQALEQVQEVLYDIGKAGIASYLQGIRSHVAQLAAPVLTECRHCGFRVALNEAPQGEGK